MTTEHNTRNRALKIALSTAFILTLLCSCESFFCTDDYTQTMVGEVYDYYTGHPISGAQMHFRKPGVGPVEYLESGPSDGNGDISFTHTGCADGLSTVFFFTGFTHPTYDNFGASYMYDQGTHIGFSGVLYQEKKIELHFVNADQSAPDTINYRSAYSILNYHTGGGDQLIIDNEESIEMTVCDSVELKVYWSRPGEEDQKTSILTSDQSSLRIEI